MKEDRESLVSYLVLAIILFILIYGGIKLVEHIIQYNEYKEFYHMYNTMIY